MNITQTPLPVLLADQIVTVTEMYRNHMTRQRGFVVFNVISVRHRDICYKIHRVRWSPTGVQGAMHLICDASDLRYICEVSCSCQHTAAGSLLVCPKLCLSKSWRELSSVWWGRHNTGKILNFTIFGKWGKINLQPFAYVLNFFKFTFKWIRKLFFVILHRKINNFTFRVYLYYKIQNTHSMLFPPMFLFKYVAWIFPFYFCCCSCNTFLRSIKYCMPCLLQDAIIKQGTWGAILRHLLVRASLCSPWN